MCFVIMFSAGTAGACFDLVKCIALGVVIVAVAGGDIVAIRADVDEACTVLAADSSATPSMVVDSNVSEVDTVCAKA
ncbi:hypothetical protein ACHAXS_009113 [Conticribra weissflogii]